MNFRRPKSITTDFRPPPAGRGFPLESAIARPGAAACRAKDGLDFLSESRKREALEHDRNVSGMSLATHVAAFQDLRAKRAWDMKDPAHRWELARKAAHLRAILAAEKRGVAA